MSFNLPTPQNDNIRNNYEKTGAGAVPLREQLTTLDILVLNLVGEHAVCGIPNIQRAPVLPGEEDYLATPDQKPPVHSWNPRASTSTADDTKKGSSKRRISYNVIDGRACKGQSAVSDGCKSNHKGRVAEGQNSDVEPDNFPRFGAGIPTSPLVVKRE